MSGIELVTRVNLTGNVMFVNCGKTGFDSSHVGKYFGHMLIAMTGIGFCHVRQSYSILVIESSLVIRVNITGLLKDLLITGGMSGIELKSCE